MTLVLQVAGSVAAAASRPEAIPYRSSDSRNRDLARYLDFYNTARPHYALSKQPPAQRLNALLNNVLRNDS